MSPRAAWRLESLGFEQIYDYEDGKADWLAYGLPVERSLASEPTAGDVARTAVPTCRLEERLPAVRRRTHAAGWPLCVVVNEERVVLGLLGRAALAREDDVTAEEAMRPGPGTIRPDTPLRRITERLRERDLSTAMVTTPDGRLVGVLFREEAERGSRAEC